MIWTPAAVLAGRARHWRADANMDFLDSRQSRVAVLLPGILTHAPPHFFRILGVEDEENFARVVQQARQRDETGGFELRHEAGVLGKSVLLLCRPAGIPALRSLDDCGECASSHGDSCGSGPLPAGPSGALEYNRVWRVLRPENSTDDWARAGSGLLRLTLPRRLPDAMRVGKDLSELIYAASANDGEPSSRLAEEAARRIEDDIASSGFLPGCSLGSLRVLSERYRVGRAVIREALGLLERRGLGKMRPGPCGGFILTKPRCDGVARELAQHFRTSGITLQQLLDAREAVDLRVVRMARAARSRNPIPPASSAESPATEPDPLAARLQLAQGAGEPTLVVLVECLNQLPLDFLPASAAQWVG